MNTTRSEKKAKEFLASKPVLKRKFQTYERTLNAGIREVFPQFCPTREYDWINGWDCDLLYTTTGYVEKDCIFSTPKTCSLGPGLWIFTGFEENKRVELVRIVENSLVIHLRINFTENNDGTTTVVWDLTFTGINEQGYKMVDSISEQDPAFSAAVDGLGYFLENGDLKEV